MDSLGVKQQRRRLVRRSAKMMRMKEIRFCIKVIVTGKENLENQGSIYDDLL